jgi:LPS O-antigen subunit length determinant protein (WzzB/FepE family)
MMASIHDDYVLIALDPPFVPEKKSGPIRSLIVILSTMVAGMLSVMFVLVRHYF